MECVIKEIPIYYEIQGSGMPLLMIHGWSVDHRLMKGCMEPVFETRNIPWQRIYFDLPGMGKTPGPAWINGSDQMLEVILEFVDKVIPGQPFLVAGESYGGYLARGLIKARREQVKGMLLICPVAIQGERNKLPALQVLEKDEDFLNSLSAEEREYFTGINVLQTQKVWDKFSTDILPALKIADYDFLENHLGQNVSFKEDVDQISEPYRQPTLFLMGRQDSVVGYYDHWQLIENFSRISFVILDRAGHNLQIEQDEVFEALVKEWLLSVWKDQPLCKGLLLKESLSSLDILEKLTITKSETWDVRNAAPDQPSIWTALSFEVEESRMAEIEEELSRALKPKWFVDCSTETQKYVIFSGKVFKYARGDQEQRALAQDFGRKLGIPESQLDWGE